jgi:hypothetical protein
VPRTSTATPGPPHTPHASTVDAQHRPPASSPILSSQHKPVDISMKPSQQLPRASTTPCGHGWWLTTNGVSHVSPAQGALHSQARAAVLQVQWDPGQSAAVWHSQARAPEHASLSFGLRDWWAHSASGTTAPLGMAQATDRFWKPLTAVHMPSSALQGSQGPTLHAVIEAGQGNRLQGRVVAGGVYSHARTSSHTHAHPRTPTTSRVREAQGRTPRGPGPPHWHAESHTCTVSFALCTVSPTSFGSSSHWALGTGSALPFWATLMHVAGGDVMIPTASLELVTQGREHALHSSLGIQNSGGHGSGVQGSTLTGRTSAEH